MQSDVKLRVDDHRRPGTDAAVQSLSVHSDGLQLLVDPDSAGLAVDVEFDGHRVWSYTTEALPGLQQRAWPTALAPYVGGRGEVTVRRSADRAELGSCVATIGESSPRRLVDEHGRWMAVNKWGHLGVPLDGRDAGFQNRLLERTHHLIEYLLSAGYEPFVCSGTLLGAIRSGALLPHDDDVDLAFVAGAAHPVDVNLVSYRMQGGLELAGYRIVRHSGAHLQVTFLLEDGALDHYIDIFTGYFGDDGEYNQPFAMRGRISPEVIYPLVEVDLEGEPFPAPADPPAMLELNYGPGWRVPDPAYTFDLPRAMTRRFEAAFGSFNHGRDHWESVFSQAPGLTSVDDATLAVVGEAPFIVDFGAGCSGLAAALHTRGSRVIAVDYSLEALSRQSAARVETRYGNIGDRRDALHLAAEVLAVGIEPTLVLDGFVEWIRPEARDNLELFLRGALAGGGRAIVRIRTSDQPTETTPYMPEAVAWVTGLDSGLWSSSHEHEYIILRRRLPSRAEAV